MPADVGVVRAVGHIEARSVLARGEGRGHQRHVGQVRAAREGVVEHDHLAGAHGACGHGGLHGEGHAAQVHGDVRGLGHHLAARVEHGAREVRGAP